MLHVMPTETCSASGPRLHDILTTEHCFIRKAFAIASGASRPCNDAGMGGQRSGRGLASASLALFDLEDLSIQSDHVYALRLHVWRAPISGTTDGSQLSVPRYRVALLAEEEARGRLVKIFHMLLAAQPARRGIKVEAVGKLNARLTWLIQETSRLVLGEIRKRGRDDDGSTGLPPARHCLEDGIAGDMAIAIGRAKMLARLAPEERPADSRPEAVMRSIKEAMRSSKENAPIMPTPEAASRGESALTENEQLLRLRWSTEEASHDLTNASRSASEYGSGGKGISRDDAASSYEPTTTDIAGTIESITTDEIRAAISALDTSKGCGIDGIHGTVMRALLDTPATELLTDLYALCLREGTTPAAWGHTIVHLITKDERLPRDASNLRPLSLIVLFRKVFEGLLLRRITSTGWAAVHAAQADFRQDYSTMTNAAVLHYLLLSRQRPAAIFLDFRTAFDLVKPRRLRTILHRRGCPQRL